MIRSCYALALGLCALLVPAMAQAQSPVFSSTTKGTPDIKSIDAVGFAPGALLIGDGKGAQVFAIKIASQPSEKWTTTELPGLKDKLAERIGTTAKGIEILKMVVDPQSNLAYVAVRKLEGKKDLILTVDASFKIRELPLENIEYARVSLAPGDKVAVIKITDIAWAGKAILVAAQAKETFGSKVLVVPGPIANDAKGILFSTETYHVAHGKWETNAPIRTIMPYQEKGKNYLVGAFTCTPIVKYAIDDLTPGGRVKGVSIIELGSGNTPQDMFTYEKAGKSYILMSTVRNNKVAVKNIGAQPVLDRQGQSGHLDRKRQGQRDSGLARQDRSRPDRARLPRRHDDGPSRHAIAPW